VQAVVQEMARSLGPEAFVRQTRAPQRRRDQQATIRRITQPVLIVGGWHDLLSPARRQEIMAELIPGARLEIMSDAGHLPSLESPSDLTRILRDWLRQPLVLR